MNNNYDDIEVLSFPDESKNKPLNSNNNSPKKKKKTVKRKIKLLVYRLIMLIALIVFLVSGFHVITWLYDNYRTGQQEKEVKKLASVTISKKGDAVNPPSSNESSTYVNDYWKYLNVDLISVDFADLLNKNKDTVAWLKVNNTNINYPVVQAKDNSYYLTHAFNKSINSAGWVFSDYRNDYNNLNSNTIIYGHGRLDGSVFGSLKNILTKSWQSNKDNYVIKMSTPKENTSWLVFSTYSIETESYYITSNFTSVSNYQTFLDTMLKRSVYNYNVSVNTNDKILTLSTCKNDYGTRIVLHAKLIKREIR